jgi:hypothetical protein
MSDRLGPAEDAGADRRRHQCPPDLDLRSDANGHRPVHGGVRKLQEDPHWRDLVLFYEYFHGDNGAGIGASHQTGWTALVAGLIALFGTISPEKLQQEGAAAIAREPAAP